MRPYWNMYSENRDENREPSGLNWPPQHSRNWTKRRMQPWQEVMRSRHVSRVKKLIFRSKRSLTKYRQCKRKARTKAASFTASTGLRSPFRSLSQLSRYRWKTTITAYVPLSCVSWDGPSMRAFRAAATAGLNILSTPGQCCLLCGSRSLPLSNTSPVTLRRLVRWAAAVVSPAPICHTFLGESICTRTRQAKCM